MKTDGTYIYTISNQVLSIILAYPVEKLKLMAKINYKDFNPTALFVQGDYIAVFGTKYDTISYPCPYYDYPYPIYGIQPVLASAAAPNPAARLLQDKTSTARIAAAAKIAPSILPIIRPPWGGSCSYQIPYTYIKIYSSTNKAAPLLTKEFQVSGSYLNGRKLDNGFMYLITTHEFNYIRRPWYDFGSGKIDVSSSSIFWYPGAYTRPSAVNIISFNLGNP